MKSIFFHDCRFINDNNKYYTSGGFQESLFERYLEVFEEIEIVARVEGKNGTNSKFICKENEISKININGISINFRNVFSEVKKAVKNCDCAIVRLPSIVGIIAIAYCKLYKKPFLTEVVGCIWDSLRTSGKSKGKLIAPILYLIHKYEIYTSSHVIYVSEKFLPNRYPTRGKSICCSDVNIGVLNNKILQSKTIKIKNNKLNKNIKLGLVGPLDVDYKGHKIAIEAVSLLQLKHKYDITLHFLGEGNKNKWIDIARDHRVESQIVFDGVLPGGQEVFKWIDDLDILLIPSYTEGLPRILIEAMSRACPALGSDAGGISELLSADLLHTVGDSNKLAKDIYKIISDDKWRIEICKMNFEKAKEYEKKILDNRRRNFLNLFKKDTNI